MEGIRFVPKRFASLAATAALGLCTMLDVSPVIAQVQVAIEYGYTLFSDSFVPDSWFVTWFPDETELLDAGAFDSSGGPFWLRSGQKFNVWSSPVDGAVPTCRFFGFGDHFYTAYAAECAALQDNTDWIYEGVVFYLKLPDENGNCPAGTTILYRLYNNGEGGVPIHRLTTSVTEFNLFTLYRSWVAEGDGRTFAFACVPSSP